MGNAQQKAVPRRPGAAFLEGNYAPVLDELQEARLEVVMGSLPAELNGTFFRIGPNPAHPPTKNYHWFDGGEQLTVGVCAGNRLVPCCLQLPPSAQQH